MDEKELIAISRKELVELMELMAKSVTTAVREVAQPKLPVYYKFPEDIVSMTGGYIAVSTIRGWKTAGYLRTVKIGSKTYVRPDDWEWFLENHRELMAHSPRSRGKRFTENKTLTPVP